MDFPPLKDTSDDLLLPVNCFDAEKFESLKLIYGTKIEENLIRVIYQDNNYDWASTIENLDHLVVIEKNNEVFKAEGLGRTRVTTPKLKRQAEAAQKLSLNPSAQEFKPFNHPNQPPRTYSNVLFAQKPVYKKAKPKPKPKTPPPSNIPAKVREEINSHQKVLVLMRGIPGSGKTYMSHCLCSEFEGETVSTDDYFYDGNNVYNFDRTRLDEAHQWCQNRARNLMKNGRRLVVVDNTNTEKWEMVSYARMAQEFAYHLILLEPDTPWKYNPAECAKRNSHGVSRVSIEFMLLRFDKTVTANSLMSRNFVSTFQPIPDKKACLTKISKDPSPSTSKQNHPMIIPSTTNKILPTQPIPLNWSVADYPMQSNESPSTQTSPVIVYRSSGTQTELRDFASLEDAELAELIIVTDVGHEFSYPTFSLPTSNGAPKITYDKSTMVDPGQFPDELIWDKKIEKLKERFPSASVETIDQLLLVCHGDLVWTMSLMTSFEPHVLAAENGQNDLSPTDMDDYYAVDMDLSDEEVQADLEHLSLESNKMDGSEYTAMTSAGHAVTDMYLELPLELATKLSSLYGTSGETTYTGLKFPISDNLARMIYEEWSASTSDVKPATNDAILVDIVEIDADESKPLISTSRTPTQDIPVPKSSFEEIMHEQKAVEDSRKSIVLEAARKRDRVAVKRHIDIERMRTKFPAIDLDLLETYYNSCNGDATSAMIALSKELAKNTTKSSDNEWIRKLQSKEGAFIIPDKDIEVAFDYGPHKIRKNDYLDQMPIEAIRSELDILMAKKNRLQKKAQESYDRHLTISPHLATYYRAEAAGIFRSIQAYRRALIRRHLKEFKISPINKLDLHELHVDEAIDVLKYCIDSKRKNMASSGQAMVEIDVVTGWGSGGTAPRIKPAVEQYLQQTGLKYHLKNVGCFTVFISRK